MTDSLSLLLACEDCYNTPDITGGPDGRDGAMIRKAPDGATLLVFRGTLCSGEAGFLDWLNDLRAELVSRPEYPGRVHDGFAASLDDLWPKLPQLEPPLVIAGHSKGGALALLAAARLLRLSSRWHDHAPSVVSFGSPMTGDYPFAGFCSLLPYLRYANPHDIVPRLPLFDYWPVGRCLAPQASWDAPRGVIANHELETGYRPWIEALPKAA